MTDPHLWFAYWIGLFLVLGKTSVVSDVYVAAHRPAAIRHGWPDG